MASSPNRPDTPVSLPCAMKSNTAWPSSPNSSMARSSTSAAADASVAQMMGNAWSAGAWALCNCTRALSISSGRWPSASNPAHATVALGSTTPGALAMRCSCHCTKSCPSGSYAVVSAPVKGCEWRVAMSVMSDLCEPVPKNRKCPGVPGWAFTASRAAFRACSRLVPSSVPSACCTSSTISTTSTLALATSSENACASVAPPGVPRCSIWKPRVRPTAPRFSPLKRCSKPEPGVCICCSVARTASSTRVAGLLLRSAHRSTYTTSAPRASSAGTRSCRRKVVLPTRRMPDSSTPERTFMCRGDGCSSCCAICSA